MNIEMINSHGANRVKDTESITYGNPSSVDSRMKAGELGFSLDITGTVTENAAYGKEDLKSAQDIAQMAGAKNVKLQRNYMAVMSNSMSSEDFAKLMEDGVNPTDTEVSESVTNLDKIKIKLAEAGVSIVGFNDDLSAEDIEAVTGSKGRAESIAKAQKYLERADLPATKENIDGLREVLTASQSIEPLSDEAMKYMLENNAEPSISNLYKAEYSAGTDNMKIGSAVRYAGAATYAGAASTDNAWDVLKQQAVNVVKDAKIEDTEDGLKDAKWLVEHQIPLTVKSLTDYRELKSISLPADPNTVLNAAKVAVEEGKSPMEADLSKSESLYNKAARLVDEFAKMSDGGDITRRRQLEEVRLVMTSEANLTLLRKGIHIETEPLEKLVTELKEAELEFYRPLLETDKGTDPNYSGNNDEEQGGYNSDGGYDAKIGNAMSLADKIDLYKATRRVVEEIPSVPAEAVVGAVRSQTNEQAVADTFTLSSIHEKGIALKSTYDRAGQSYEALMTAPRADMGDSIKKAFANTDDILKDLEMDINEANRKAIRTLGYAKMEITKESIDNIRDAVTTVNRVIELMTPAKTLKMIREGHNPLNENIYDLERELSEETEEESNTKYSEFLWKLEKSGNITEDEKQAYIGIYRLFNQIEKQDGKVIGNVLSSGRELTMQNMLSASRSNRHMNTDVSIDDDFGLLEEVIAKGDLISDQIMQGFLKINNAKAPKSYADEKLKDVRVASMADPKIADILREIDEPVTVENIIATNDMLSTGGRAFKRLFGRSESNRERREETEGILTTKDAQEFTERFTDRESAIEAYDILSRKALTVAKGEIKNAVSYEESRQWSMLYKQVGIAAAISRNETYEVPIETESGMANIHLTIRHDGTEGKVSASFEADEYGRVDAQFIYKDTGVDGIIVSDSRYGADALKDKEKTLIERFETEGIKVGNLSFVFSAKGMKTADSDFTAGGVTNGQLYAVAKAFIKAFGTQ